MSADNPTADIYECTNVSPFRVISTIAGNPTVFAGKYICDGDPTIPYMGNADQVLFNNVNGGLSIVDLCKTLIKTGIDTTYYPI